MIQGLWQRENTGQDLINIVYGRLKNLARYPFQNLFSKKSGKNAVTTWLFAKKPKQLG
jgi:hypothetical protein